MTVTPEYWEKAKKHLSKRDKIMKKIIASYNVSEGLERKHDAFITLARSITGQQISVKAADTIWNRMENAVGEVSPARILKIEEQILRESGYSKQKISYLKNIAENFANGKISSEILMAKTEEEALKELIKLKGIGKWTAEMFLIFHLQKPDIFPIDDIGVQKAIKLHYSPMLSSSGLTRGSIDIKKMDPRLKAENDKKDSEITKQKMLILAETWRPYRTVATWYLWRSLDPIPVQY